MTNSVRRLDPKYAAAEFLWYFDPTGSIDMITKYAPQYKNFAEPSGEVHGAYGKRFVYYFKPLIEQLKIEGNRRCVIALYESSDLMHPQAKDIPCTLNWQFIVDDNKLCMIANMRSNDVWLGMPYDIYVNTLIQRVIASNLGLECGWYQHQVMNIHLYERDWKKVEDMKSYVIDTRPLFVKDSLTTLDIIIIVTGKQIGRAHV